MITRVKHFFSPHRITLSARMTILGAYTPKSENLSLTLYAANYGDKKRYRAKHVLSKVEGTPSTQRKTLTYFSEPWRPLRLCARHVFPTSSSSPNFKYLWLDFGFSILDFRSENLEVGSRISYVE
jgi:hypothetical protein